MKALLISMLIISGCSKLEFTVIDPAALKFAAGDTVKTKGFYTNCVGIISGYVVFKNKIDPFKYSVIMKCGDYGVLVPNLIVEESLLERVK